MNKKLFLALFAVIGLLFATSCSHEELDVVQDSEMAQVTFSLGVENSVGTKAAISDGSGADKLIYAVFDKAGKRLTNIPAVTTTETTFPTTVKLTLAKGQTYKVAFWAQNNDCDAYTVDTDLMKVEVKYDGVNNDETRDAFFKTVEFAVSGSTSINVVMTRPFAQINVGVTEGDWNAAVASGIEVEKSSVVIKNAAKYLNLLTGAVSEFESVSYTLENIPNEDLTVDTDKDGVKETYKWLSMSYILPADETTGYEKATLDNISFEFSPKEQAYNKITLNQGLNSVPVQRNWRTNILGKLLTGDITFNIVIDPVYENDRNQSPDNNVFVPYATINGVAYTTFAEAFAAVKDGETIKLEGEVTLDGVVNGNLFTIDGKSVTIDLNGYGIVANVPDVTKNSAIFRVAKNSELTIVGEGNVKVVTNKATNALAAFINNDGGTVNLKGGNWTMTALDKWQESLIPTFVDNNSNVNSATLNIYDGTYTFHRNLFRNYANAASHNGYATVATINIYGGTFNGRDDDAGAIWNQKPSATVPDGAGVVNVMGGTFNNVVIDDEFAGVVYVNNQEELNAALANVNTHTVMLGAGEFKADIYNGTPARKSLTIIGSEGTKFGHTATTGGQLRLDLFESFTISNCEIIQRSGVKTWGHIVFGSGNKANGVYTIENCTFNGVGTQGIYINENTSGATYNILNCTFDGDFGTEGAITIQTNQNVNHIVNVKGCTFNNIPNTSHRIFLAKSKDGFYYGWTLNTDLDLAKELPLYYLNNALENGTTGELNLVENVNYGTITVGTLKDVTIKGAEGSVMIFKTNADTKIENVTLENVSFEYTGATADCGVVIDANAQIDNLVLEGCTFTGTGAKAGRGLSGLNNNASIEIKDCIFKDLGYPVYAWGSYKELTIEGCTFENIKSWAIMPQSGFDGNLTVTECTFKDCLGGGLIKAGTLTAGHTFTFTNNIITGCTIAGDHNWFQFNVSAGTSVISGNKKDGADWTPSAAEGLK